MQPFYVFLQQILNIDLFIGIFAALGYSQLNKLLLLVGSPFLIEVEVDFIRLNAVIST